MGLPTTETLPGVEPPGKSFLGRLLGVFVSPGETFADVVRRPDFIAPLVLLVVCSVTVTESLLAHIGMARILRTALEERGQSANITPEQFQRAVNIQNIIAHVSGVVVLPVLLLILAGIGLLIVNVMFGAQVSFLKAFSVTCYAGLVHLLEYAMGLAMIFLGDPEHFNVRSFIPTSPGFFLNPLETSKVVMALASSLDLFTFWVMALLGVGFSAATGRKVGAGKIFLVLLGLWVAWVLIRVGMAVLF
jgi:Yip1 domain